MSGEQADILPTYTTKPSCLEEHVLLPRARTDLYLYQTSWSRRKITQGYHGINCIYYYLKCTRVRVISEEKVPRQNACIWWKVQTHLLKNDFKNRNGNPDIFKLTSSETSGRMGTSFGCGDFWYRLGGQAML